MSFESIPIAKTVPLMESPPNVELQLVPSHFAIGPVVTPPALLKFPPA